MDEIESFKCVFERFKPISDFYNSITEISKSKGRNPQPAVIYNKKIFSMDDLCTKVHKNIKELSIANHCKHSSVDGFYYLTKNDKIVLIFIEFKIIYFNQGNYRQYLTDEIKPKLKIKALETLNCVLPNLLEQYSFNEDIQKILFEAPKYYYCVIYYPDAVSETNARQALESDYMDMSRLSHHPFKQVRLITPRKFKEIMDVLTINGH